MLLERLVADADLILEDTPPEMYALKPVRWVIELDATGQLVGCVPPTGGGRRGDRGLEMMVPVGGTRTSGVKAVLLADNANYALGIPKGDGKERARHDAFCELHRAAGSQLPETGLGAVVAFLDALNRHEARAADDALSEVSPEDMVTFRVAGRLVCDSPQVRQWWADNWDGNGSSSPPAKESGAASQCLVCGKTGVLIDQSLPMNLRGIPRGQTSGTALVSINDVAFESFGLARGAGSCVCRSCGQAFMRCLNALLADERRHMAIGPLVYVYWTDGIPTFNPFDFVREPDPKAVEELLRSVVAGRYRTVDTSSYHIVCLSASSARAVVRDWIDVTGEQLQAALSRWFSLLQQVDAWGSPGEPRGIWRLAAAAYRDARKEMDTGVPRALMAAALKGERMPAALLARLVSRCRIERDVTYERAVLVKALLATRRGWKEGEMTAAEPHETDSAYQSGRVLALLEDIQRAALGKVGATVVDKYYGAASAAPASVLGRLVGDAQNHLARLRRDRGGLHQVLQERLERVLSGIDAFPRTLTLERQGMFALGYYHERAAGRAGRSKTVEVSAAESAPPIEEN